MFGGGSYLYLAAAARALEPQEFGAISGLWLLINVLGIGLFLPLEQELARALSARHAIDQGGRPVLARVTILGLAGLSALGLASWPFTGWLVNRALGGEPHLLFAMWLGVVGYALAFIQRGALAGTGEFGAYGRQLTWDGLVRVIGGPALVLAGVHSPLAFAVLLGLAPWLSILFSLPAVRPALAHGPAPALVGGRARSHVPRCGVIRLAGGWQRRGARCHAHGRSRGPHSRWTCSLRRCLGPPSCLHVRCRAGSLLARSSPHGRAQRMAPIPRIRARLSCLAGGLTLLGAAVVAIRGSALVGVVFGGDAALSNGPLVLLTLGSGLSIVAAIVGQALVVLQRYRTGAVAWAVGMLAWGLGRDTARLARSTEACSPSSLEWRSPRCGCSRRCAVCVRIREAAVTRASSVKTEAPRRTKTPLAWSIAAVFGSANSGATSTIVKPRRDCLEDVGEQLLPLVEGLQRHLELQTADVVQPVATAGEHLVLEALGVDLEEDPRRARRARRNGRRAARPRPPGWR